MWKTRDMVQTCRTENNQEKFSNVDESIKTYKTEEQHIKILFITIENHLFHNRKVIIIRTPLQYTPDGLSIEEEV